MTIKTALLELKETLDHQNVDQLDETYIHELEQKNNLKTGTLPFYFNHLMMVNLNNAENQSTDSKKVNRKWTKSEVSFMFQYISERQAEGALNITEILEEVATLLNRGYQSVNYKYYTIVKAKEKKEQETFSKEDYHFTTISHQDVPVIATELIKDDVQTPTQETQTMKPQDDDLLDILSGLISNVQQLPGINLNELFKSLYQLTNMALQNQDAAQQMQSMKSEINQEKETLEQKLLQEKKRNDQLQMEVAKLAREVMAFNKLGDAAKIQNLKSYSQRLNYIIDGTGVVVQVGS
jgi:hypothetical protein